MAWECKKCGACCEVIPKALGLGCSAYNPETKQCDDYENRPPACRSKIFKISDEVQEATCEKLRVKDFDGAMDVVLGR